MSRRLFSTQIVDSDAFLDMPPTTQNFYFHLGMRADDDGFVGNPKKILRMIGGNDDDLKILTAKRFILAFESGVIVIKHWLIHNSIRKDRYHPTQYLEEKGKLRLKDNDTYTDDVNIGKKLGNQMAPQVKVSKDKVSKDNKVISFFSSLFQKEYNTEPSISEEDCELSEKVLSKHPIEEIKEIIKFYKDSEKCEKYKFKLSVALSNDTINEYILWAKAKSK